MIWKCGRFEFDTRVPVIMGILNATPDSFSGDGLLADVPAGGVPAGGAGVAGEGVGTDAPGGPVSASDAVVQAALAQARALRDAGARTIDVGGESTRPGAQPVSADEELARVLPVVRALAEEGFCVSIDTRHAQVAQACVAAGASIVNDVTGFADPAMRRVAVQSDAGLVLTHCGGHFDGIFEMDCIDPVDEVREWLARQAAALEAEGIARNRICVDFGPGFGKSVRQTINLVYNFHEFRHLGYPVMAALSRKRFISEMYRLADAPSREEVPSREGAAQDAQAVTGALGSAGGAVTGESAAAASGVALPDEAEVADGAAGGAAAAEAGEATATSASASVVLSASDDADDTADRSAAASDSSSASASDPDPRDAPSAEQALMACELGAGIVRTHNVEVTAAALRDLRPYCVVSLGCNVPLVAEPGEEQEAKIAQLNLAISELSLLPDTQLIDVSPFYESEPAYYRDQDPFVNAVALLRTGIAPKELLDYLHAIENSLGRVREIPNGPRTLDLDIVDYQTYVVESETLVLPHPRTTERDFVVKPLEDILPGHILADGTPVAAVAEQDRIGRAVRI